MANRSRVTLSPAARDVMLAEAARAYPHEACGILVGTDGGDTRLVRRAIPAGNVADPARLRDRYVIDPRAVLAAERAAEAAGEAVVGFFHSHPDHPARPSAEDLARAWPWYVYAIVSVRGGTTEDVRAWRVNSAGGAFEELAFT